MNTAIYKEGAHKMIMLLLSVLFSMILTLFFLSVFSFFLWKWEVAQNVQNIGLICIKIAACFGGGFFCGKKNEKKSFLWGMLAGCLYFAALYFLSILMGTGAEKNTMNFITTFFYCGAGGMLGGMIS